MPAFGRGLDFDVRSLGQAGIDGARVQTFSLTLSGVLALVSPEMHVAYVIDDRSLRRFTGVSNIRSDHGKPLKTRIDFPKPPQTASDAQWQASLSTPLAPCPLGA